MAIVHPAFCVVGHDSMEPFARSEVHGFQPAGTDTKHFKNSVYSSRTADVFSVS
jgi:hypothetical protein